MRWACRCCSVVLPAPTNDVDAHGQVAWSWHPDADAALMRQHHAQRWPKSPEHRGEREAAVPTIARGMPGCLG